MVFRRVAFSWYTPPAPPNMCYNPKMYSVCSSTPSTPLVYTTTFHKLTLLTSNNLTSMSVRYSPQNIRIPDGFQDILEALAREVGLVNLEG